MDRRAFLAAGAGAFLAAPLAARGQATRAYRVGALLQGDLYSRAIDGLRDGLREAGFDEGKHYVLSVHDARGDLQAVEAAARQLEAEKADLLYAVASSVAVRTKRATKSVPIVFYAGTDPSTVGLVESLRRPGGRLTGVYGRFTDVTAKRLGLLKEMVPRIHRVLVFYDPDNPASQQSVKAARAAARQLKLELVERRVASVEQMRVALHALRPGEVDAIGYVSDAMVTSQSTLLLETARTLRLPTMFQEQDSVAQGGLASYGLSFRTIGKLSARYVHRVLLGANPGDLPVEGVDRFDFVVNLKTARELGLTIPQSLVQRADQVIE